MTSENVKSKLYLVLFLATAIILGIGVWKNYRPQVIYASCADIAEKTTNFSQRKEITKIDPEKSFDAALNDCLSDAGYYENK